MARIIEVDRSMVDDVHGLVSEFDLPGTTRSMWERALDPPWDTGGRPPGYAVDDGGRLVGFMGTLFVRRRIGERTRELCNCHGLIVHDEHRGQAARMLVRALKLPDVTLTVLTPVRPVAEFLRGVGFVDAGDRLRVLLPTVGDGRSGRPDGLELVDDADGVRAGLDDAGRRIVDDHAGTPVRHLLIRSGERICHVAHTPVEGPVGHVHVLHVGDPDLFARHSVPIRRHLTGGARRRAVVVDARLLGGRPTVRSIEMPLGVRRFFRSRGPALDPALVDNLYTEFALLGVAGFPHPRDELRELVTPHLGRLRR